VSPLRDVPRYDTERHDPRFSLNRATLRHEF
jgi:hypothetical protein